MRTRLSLAAVAVLAILAMAAVRAPARAVPCDADNAGLTLPPGFCATIFADKIAAARHMVVAPNGDVLVVSNQTGGGRSGTPVVPGALTLLRDANGDGKAELVQRLATASGSGIALANGYLYASNGPAVVRWKYATGGIAELGAPDTIVSGFERMGHTAFNFVIVGSTLYFNVGSRTNSCQQPDRQAKVPGVDPCPELETRAGIWAFDVTKTGQKPSDGERFATGIRNSVSLTVNPADKTLWATMHGRDGLQAPPVGQWSFSNEYGAENPAEQVNHILKGDNFGWPYCYFSNEERKLVTSPEYGGDGKKDDRCTDKKKPEYAFPGHWAPNDMLFYTGKMFPAEYKSGAFVAFHGSWNRAPLPQQGSDVVFLAIKGGKAGPHRIFAEGFAKEGGPTAYDNLLHKPTGLAQGTDGSLYVADDVAGRIYKISYKGK
ncbi:MAG: PQQ-dependent sugar dehydrogenase [Gemmatimonadales bacterium]